MGEKDPTHSSQSESVEQKMPETLVQLYTYVHRIIHARKGQRLLGRVSKDLEEDIKDGIKTFAKHLRDSHQERVHEILTDRRLDDLTDLFRFLDFVDILGEKLTDDLPNVLRYVMVMDLSDFGAIDKELGALTANQVIKRVSQILASHVRRPERSSDVMTRVRPDRRGGEVLGRFGGDEFMCTFDTSKMSKAVIITELAATTIAMAFGERIQKSLREDKWTDINPRMEGRIIQADMSIICFKKERAGHVRKHLALALFDAAELGMERIKAKAKERQKTLFPEEWDAISRIDVGVATIEGDSLAVRRPNEPVEYFPFDEVVGKVRKMMAT